MQARSTEAVRGPNLRPITSNSAAARTSPIAAGMIAMAITRATLCPNEAQKSPSDSSFV